MSGFTKGEWVLEEDNDDLVIRMGTALSDRGHFEVQHEVRWEGILLGMDDEDDPQYKEAMANAHLLVAGPKMYDALKAILNEVQRIPIDVDNRIYIQAIKRYAKKAMKTARGEE